jgi:hypothetical protein
LRNPRSRPPPPSTPQHAQTPPDPPSRPSRSRPPSNRSLPANVYHNGARSVLRRWRKGHFREKPGLWCYRATLRLWQGWRNDPLEHERWRRRKVRQQRRGGIEDRPAAQSSRTEHQSMARLMGADSLPRPRAGAPP